MKTKPWEAMYRSLIIRLDEIVQNNEPLSSVELISNTHIKVMTKTDGGTTTEWKKLRQFPFGTNILFS